MKNCLPFLFLILFIISCNKSDDSENTNNYQDTSTLHLEKKVYIDHTQNSNLNHTTFYYYDSNNRLEQIKTESQTGTAYSNYNYSNNRITSVEHSNGSFLEYTYENNLIVKQVFYHNNLESVTLFEYGSANNMIVTDLGLCINTFEYDQNNNPVFINNCNSINYQFEYDTKKNPFLLVYPEYLLKIHPSGNNNATKYIYHDVIHDVMSTDIIVYEYNNENYPVKRMFYTENVLKATEEYFYSH